MAFLHGLALSSQIPEIGTDEHEYWQPDLWEEKFDGLLLVAGHDEFGADSR